MIVLASASPRRLELLQRAGWQVFVRPAAVDETPKRHESPSAYVLRLARAKARAIEKPRVKARAKEMPGAKAPAVAPGLDGKGIVILGADTTVAIGRSILGKPGSDAEAVSMLSRLSGRRHEVLTGVCLRDARTGCEAAVVAVTHVWFVSLATHRIAAYVATGEPRDKAGAYAIQGGAAGFVRRIEGSYSNVVGLPIDLVWELWLKLATAALR